MTGRQLAALIPLQLGVIIIGLRCAFIADGALRIAGLAIVLGSLMSLIGFSLAFFRSSRGNADGSV